MSRYIPIPYTIPPVYTTFYQFVYRITLNAVLCICDHEMPFKLRAFLVRPVPVLPPSDTYELPMHALLPPPPPTSANDRTGQPRWAFLWVIQTANE